MRKKTIIIAEIGVNHNGSFKLAKKLIDAASKAKVDFVKFQTSKPSLHISKFAKKAQYQIKNFPGKNNNQLKMATKLAFNFSIFPKLKKYCKLQKVKFLSSPFDIPSIKFLRNLNEEYFKIPSSEINNYPYLKEIAKVKQKIILSTGMSNFKEVAYALNILKKFGKSKKNVTIMQCNTEYPTPYRDVNLRAMITLEKKFNCDIGYSDHTKDIEVSLAAVALGAKIIEKHMTLNKKMKGPDHKASIEPDEMKKLVKSIRNIEVALGSKNKFLTNSEKKNIIIARKSIVASTDIKKGEKFNLNNITVKRPGSGISPIYFPKILGKKAKKDFYEDELILI